MFFLCFFAGSRWHFQTAVVAHLLLSLVHSHLKLEDVWAGWGRGDYINCVLILPNTYSVCIVFYNENDDVNCIYRYGHVVSIPAYSLKMVVYAIEAESCVPPRQNLEVYLVIILCPNCTIFLEPSLSLLIPLSCHSSPPLHHEAAPTLSPISHHPTTLVHLHPSQPPSTSRLVTQRKV